MTFGKLLVAAGIILVMLGLYWMLLEKKFPWPGKLPGDFLYESGNFKLFIPFTTMLLAGILISVILWVIRYFSH